MSGQQIKTLNLSIFSCLIIMLVEKGIEMRQKWSLVVKDFGKIPYAKIEVAPLLIFIGDNNSGKSYIMTLLWGLVVVGKSIFPKDVPTSESYKKCERKLQQIIESQNTISKKHSEIDKEFQQDIVDWFNALLKNRKKEFVRVIFSDHSLDIGSLEICDYERAKPLTIKWDSNEKDVSQRYSAGKDYIRFPLRGTEIPEAEKYRMIQYICWKLLMDNLNPQLSAPGTEYLVGSKNSLAVLAKRRSPGEALFLPAARTGFMLTYKNLASGLMSAWGLDDSIEGAFTLPVIRFLQGLLSSKPSQNARYNDVAEFLEGKVLRGSIINRQSTVPDYTYRPSSHDKDISLHVTSSLVVELSPVTIFLKSNMKFNVLIIEEPEAHLHPEMQRHIAQAMLRLISKGLPVWITTHSETIMQHINNMMKLKKHSDKASLLKDLGYTDEDLADPDTINAYQFTVLSEEKGTEVLPLEKTYEGFVAQTFNKTLVSLAEETVRLSRDE